MMTLKEFISATLSQIVDAVTDAQRQNKKVAPPISFPSDGRSGSIVHRGGVANPAAFIVEFDVAITVSKKTDVDAKGGVAIHVFEAGAKRTTSDEHSTVNRIKFGVPVTYDDMRESR